MHRIALALVYVLVGAFGSAVAGVIRVPQDQPTIQAAIDAAVSGDVIRIKSGTYFETLAILNKPNLTLQGIGNVVIDAEGQPLSAVLVDQCDGLLLKNLRTRRSNIGVYVEDSPDIVLLGLRVKEVEDRGLYIKTSMRVRIEKCVVEGGTDEAIRVDQSHALVADCVVPTSAGKGILLLGANSHCVGCKVKDTAGVGISVTGIASLLEKNVVVGSGGNGIEIASPGPVVLRNNTINGCGGSGVFANGDNLTVDHNTITATTGTGLEVEGDGNKLIDNSIKKAGANGLRLVGLSSNAVVFKNRVRITVNHAYSLSGSDIVFAENFAKNPLLKITAATNLDEYANQLTQ